MPGVPSGRGCDACRKQKKKCDQGKPSCSRCSRLQIKCIGSGQRRFKFKDQSITFASDTGPKAGTTCGSNAVAQVSKNWPGEWFADKMTTITMPRGPRCETTRLTQAFVSVLEVRDLRYSLATYGSFLFDTPRRVGTSKALDASITALATTHHTLYSQQGSVKALPAWGRALAALREALRDPKQVTTTETLCAIYFIYICQTWLRRSLNDSASHAEGMAHILNSLVAKDIKSDFECRILITLTAAVILESFLNPALEVNPVIWEASSAYKVPAGVRSNSKKPVDHLQLRNIADYAMVVRNPDPDYNEVLAMYTQLRTQTVKFGEDIKGSIDPTSSSYIASEERRCHTHAGYGVGTGISLMFNGILRAYHPSDPGLIADATLFAENSLLLAEQGLRFRPLGSNWMALCLIPGWVATPDQAQRALLYRYIVEYEDSTFETGWLQRAYWIERRLDTLRCVVAARAEKCNDDASSIAGLGESPENTYPRVGDGCCVM